MRINTASPIDILQGIMEACCEQHDQCVGCPRLKACRNLWDRASEQTYARPFTSEALISYIDEFNQIWQEVSKENNLFGRN